MFGDAQAHCRQIKAAIRGQRSILAQLASLAAMRDPNTGVYSAPPVPDRTGAVHCDLCRLHEEVFRRWLNLSLEAQKSDIDLYLSGFRAGRTRVVETWLSLESYRMLLPASASPAERRLFLGDFEYMLHLEQGAPTKNRSGPAISFTSGSLNFDDIVTLQEVSALLRVAPRTMRQWAEMGIIPAFKVGKLWRFRRSEVNEWLCRVDSGDK